jgi:hypothetical protein
MIPLRSTHSVEISRVAVRNRLQRMRAPLRDRSSVAAARTAFDLSSIGPETQLRPHRSSIIMKPVASPKMCRWKKVTVHSVVAGR